MSPSNVQGAGREQLFDLELLGRQALLVRIVDDRLQHFPVGLDSVGKRIGAEYFSRRLQILRAEYQAGGNALGKFFLRDLLRLGKRFIEIEREPGILPVDVAAECVTRSWAPSGSTVPSSKAATRSLAPEMKLSLMRGMVCLYS